MGVVMWTTAVEVTPPPTSGRFHNHLHCDNAQKPKAGLWTLVGRRGGRQVLIKRTPLAVYPWPRGKFRVKPTPR